MKKLYLLSLMLMGSISLFTSCVDADYYDLYEDEEEILSPRSKKGKDMPGDLSDCPLMNSDWQEAECVAICYSNIYGISDKSTCRYEVIKAEYGKFNKKNYEKYFEVVQASGVHATAADKLFGTTRLDAEDFAAKCVGLTGQYGVDKIAIWGPGQRHIAKVHSVSMASYSWGYIMTVYIVDQNPTPHARYSVTLDNNKHLINKDFEDFLKCK